MPVFVYVLLWYLKNSAIKAHYNNTIVNLIFIRSFRILIISRRKCGRFYCVQLCGYAQHSLYFHEKSFDLHKHFVTTTIHLEIATWHWLQYMPRPSQSEPRGTNYQNKSNCAYGSLIFEIISIFRINSYLKLMNQIKPPGT